MTTFTRRQIVGLAQVAAADALWFVFVGEFDPEKFERISRLFRELERKHVEIRREVTAIFNDHVEQFGILDEAKGKLEIPPGSFGAMVTNAAIADYMAGGEIEIEAPLLWDDIESIMPKTIRLDLSECV